ncbi:uncharacterized protein EV420DRAFT_1647094 [Desarmillaria tabescens]|uniref:F-box domain-containing protein n=1 Tax=Armillaria tabescens TaxID=1929756 RepID=A0AA39JUB2_ARMTA|nr:uncharacterized protein EV420DRAFT_1647094 [Desarmillaria tabescens]KAK0449061.1 hypothetical protein EV420DRAFT_1647094 [Desarmillaria tabescens]
MATTAPSPAPATMSVLATETLIQIFEHLDCPCDLFHVVQTCTVFHDIAIWMLYRHIQYNNPESFNAHTAFWEHAHDGMYDVPRSVALDNVLKHSIQGVWRSDNYHEEDDEALQLQINVWVRLLSFTSLHTLSISHCLLPDSESFSYLLQGCQSLRKPSIEACVFQEEPLDFNGSYGIFPWLPLEELSLLGENTVYDRLWEEDTSRSDREAGSFLRLLTVRSIRTLTVDLNDRNCAFLANRTPHSGGISFGNLKTLRLRLINDTVVDPRMGNDIAAFLNTQCASVNALELLGFAELTSDDVRLRPGALSHLANYKGPAAIAPGIAATGCPLKHLGTNDPTLSISQASSVLGKVGSHRPQLMLLDITIQEWDTEILYAISHLFRRVREVKIKYHKGYPDESAILSMPSMFFSNMSNMTTLHIYNPQSIHSLISHRGYNALDVDFYHMSWPAELGPSASEEVLELMAGWIKACPTLTEVKWKNERLLSRKSTRKEDK